MKINRNQAPLYGQCVLTVQLGDEELAADKEPLDYFLLFAGSTQCHLTSTLRSGHDTLQALCPAHNCCELVSVTLCSRSRGALKVPEDPVAHLHHITRLAEHPFCFVQDLAFDMAQFLVSTAGRVDGLDGALMLDECQIPLQECERLDESLALALQHLSLPAGWSLLGNKPANSTDVNPRETLLHFSARRGLMRVTLFLLQQAGAEEAVRLANRQGHTPSALAALRGNKVLHAILAQAETDPHRRTETVQLVPSDTRVLCNLPRLNTHTLTLGIVPDRDPPTLQRTVEQLQHFICHLHAKGVSVLELQSDSLHTAAECRDSLDREPACLELSAAQQWSRTENYPEDVNHSIVDGGCGGPENAVEGWTLSPSTQLSVLHLQEHGHSLPEDRVCLSSNTGRDYSHTGEEEGREQHGASAQNLSLCDGSEEAQSEGEAVRLAVGIPFPPACGKQKQEASRGKPVILEVQGVTKDKGRAKQGEDNTGRRKVEDTENTSTEFTALSAMGHSVSSEGSDILDVSDSDLECSQDDVRLEHDGLTDSESVPVDPTFIHCSDVIDAASSESDLLHLVIESAHEGEPPPDINSLEQNQETAGGDYSPADASSCSVPDTEMNSGNCTANEQDRLVLTGRDELLTLPGHFIENTTGNFQAICESAEDIGRALSICGPSPEMIHSSVGVHDDLDSVLLYGLSSEEDGSYRSVGSSITEIFHLTEDTDNAIMEKQELTESKLLELSSSGLKMDEGNNMKHDGSNEHSLSVDRGLLSDPGNARALTETDYWQAGTEPESRRSLNCHTTEPLNPEWTEQKFSPELSDHNQSLNLMFQVSRSETGEAAVSNLNVATGCSGSEVTKMSIFETKVCVSVEGEPTDEKDSQPVVTSEEMASAENSEHPKMTSSDGLKHAEIDTTVSSSQHVVAEPSVSNDTVSGQPSKEELLDTTRISNNEASGQPVEELLEATSITNDEASRQPPEEELPEATSISNDRASGQPPEEELPEATSVSNDRASGQPPEEELPEATSVSNDRASGQPPEEELPEATSVSNDRASGQPPEEELPEATSISNDRASGQPPEEELLETIRISKEASGQPLEEEPLETKISNNGDNGQPPSEELLGSPRISNDGVSGQPPEEELLGTTRISNNGAHRQPPEEELLGTTRISKEASGQPPEENLLETTSISNNGRRGQPTKETLLETISISNDGASRQPLEEELLETKISNNGDNGQPPSEELLGAPRISNNGVSGQPSEEELLGTTMISNDGVSRQPPEEELLGTMRISNDGASRQPPEVELLGNTRPIQDAVTREISGVEEKGDITAEDGQLPTVHRDKDTSYLQHSGFSSALAITTTHRDSSSDVETLLSAEPGYDGVFKQSDEPLMTGDSASEVSISCSSTDDNTSVGLCSSSPEGQRLSWSPEDSVQTGTPVPAGEDSGGGGGAGEAEEEAKDRVAEVPLRSKLFRSSFRSKSPLRRHSWGPGKNSGGDSKMNQRSYSLEGLSGVQEELRRSGVMVPDILEPSRRPAPEVMERGSLVSLTEEQEDMGEHVGLSEQKSLLFQPLRHSCTSKLLPLTKSVSMLAISQRDTDGQRSLNRISGSVACSISEEEPGPLRSDAEGKGVTKVSRTFSYLKSKMYKKTREKEKEKKEKDKESKDKEKRTVNGHLFTLVSSGQATQCSQCSQCSHCNKPFNNKEIFQCTYCNASVHKGCRETLPVCAKVKMKFPKQQISVPDSASTPAVTMRNKSAGTRERPWSAILVDESVTETALQSRQNIQQGVTLSDVLSIQSRVDDMNIKGLRYLSQSTDSLNRTNHITESMESLTDEGTEMMDGQLMGEFEVEAKDLEVDSWSLSVDQQQLQQLDKELVKRQDVIYELMQTEMHHVRTLRIMSEVYSKGLQKEVQLEQQTVDKLFPALDELLELHTQHLLRLLERKRESQHEGGSFDGGFLINRIGDILANQFAGSNAESMKRVYGKFCSRHNEAVNFYKELLTKDKRFKAFIKKKMSSSVVRRLGIPECILLVTQRITKYPVLFQRMLHYTKEGEEDYEDLKEAVQLVRDVIAAVDCKVNEHEKKRRLKEFHSRLDSKSIMMMNNGQMFAREDLLRRRLIHEGALQLKNSQGRLKDVHALLLLDVFVFLQEKDQKYIFALLDQRSTVISLQKLIVREVANEERGVFLITAGIEKPEMMEVLASSKEERNMWMQLIQEAMQSMEKDEDEGIPSETEEDKRQLESKTKELRDLLRQKDAEIMSLLEEKVRLFRGLCEGLTPGEEACREVEPFFRSVCSLDPPRGASIMNEALVEVETLQELVNSSLGGAMASVHEGGAAGPVCLPRRAETFGGFDSHQMHISKNGDRDESEDTVGDLRRTESDSVLKKGGNANLLLLLKRSSEQVLHSISNLHLLLSSLQAVVVQQDSFIEDQRQTLNERSSSCTSLSRQSSRPSSLIEQEKQRSLEKQRQELASLQRQQAAHAEEKKRREKEWELREQQLAEREDLLSTQEEEVRKQTMELQEQNQELQSKKENYQKELERLRDAQRKLDRDREAMQRQLEKMEQLRLYERTPSTTSDDSQFASSSHSLELDPQEVSSSLTRLQSQRSKPKSKGLNPFTSLSTNPSMKDGESHNQVSKSLLQLAKTKNKEGKEKKKKKKGKGGNSHMADSQHQPEPPFDGEIFFC
ncbi:A-kinase anchor protein 13-like [Thalassophryne amazonica]|uniref:A-kinase anchor protein 13-like n=1 Tax=Thalassophryne amazonica TaxID=390379 RepID=UPI001471029C|nr:A-kinase anchor protein 13-like [Thalassophryne amazonica]